MPHEARCANRLRARREAQHGRGVVLPPAAVRELVEEIVRCCLHTRLKAFRLAYGWSVNQAVERVHELCRREGLGARGMTRRSVLEWESGEHHPSPDYQDLLCRVYGASPMDLGFAVDYAPGPRARSRDNRDQLQVLVRRVAAASMQHATGCELTDVGELQVDVLNGEVTRLARSYVHAAPAPLHQELVAIRDEIYRLLAARRTPAQAVDLYLLSGQVCGLLANAALDLGNRSAAMAQARVAWTYAEIIDHPGLRSWVRGLQAMIAYWGGEARTAALLAENGLVYAPAGMARARLEAIMALARAALGDATGVRDGLSRSQDAWGVSGWDTLHDEVGGEFAFTPAKLAYLAAGAHAHLRAARPAVENAATAIRLYEAGSQEERSYGNEALARVFLADGFLLQEDLDGANEALTQLIALPESHRIDGLVTRMLEIRSRLEVPRLRTSATARCLVETVDEFTATAVVPPS